MNTRIIKITSMFLLGTVVSACKGEKPQEVAMTGFKLSPTSITLVYEGTPASQQIIATAVPENATNIAFSWMSEDETVAAVSPTGLVTATGVGSTHIVVTGDNIAIVANKTLRVPVTVSSTSNTLPDGYTGIEEYVELNDPKYGAPQYIGKLFTEGLGRAPHPDEYKRYTAHILANGCTQASLAYLAEEMFGSADFLGLGLSNEQTTFCIYRAMLNRDPSNLEIEQGVVNLQSGATPAALAADLTAFDEFNLMLPDIIRGSILLE